MKKPNKRHRNFINHIMKCGHGDIIEQRMMNLPQVASARIDGGWTKYAMFKFHDGKRFYANWCLDSEKELKQCFKWMLEHMRKQRRGLIK